jgi:Ca2+-binding EF-hand superfamily protein
MSKKAAKPVITEKSGSQLPIISEKNVRKTEHYAIPIEEVRDIKAAFDIFDVDLSGVVDPQELKRAF